MLAQWPVGKAGSERRARLRLAPRRRMGMAQEGVQEVMALIELPMLVTQVLASSPLIGSRIIVTDYPKNVEATHHGGPMEVLCTNWNSHC